MIAVTLSACEKFADWLLATMYLLEWSSEEINEFINAMDAVKDETGWEELKKEKK